VVVVVVGLTIGEIALLGDVREMFLDDPSAFFAAGRAVKPRSFSARCAAAPAAPRLKASPGR